MNDGQYETPVDDKPRIAPRVVLASAGVVVATLFATVAALTSGSQDEATPGGRNPLEDVVSKSTLRSAPSVTGSTTPTQTEVEALSSVEAPASTTTTPPRKTRVTTVTKPDGTTTTTTVDDTTPESPVVPPVYQTTTTTQGTTTSTTTTTTDPVTTTTTQSSTPVSSNDG